VSTGSRHDEVPVIAIDGPTASGKGSVAHRLATALGWHYLDSGALYRLVALMVLRDGLADADETALADLAIRLPAVFEGDRIRLGGDDVTDAIRAEAVGNEASRIAVMAPVRRALVDRQRSFRRAPGLVAEGRDMGTVIFPDARLKVFLTASAEARAARRYKQLKDKGFSASLPDLLRDLEARDRRDATRTVAPLVPAKDALTIDSTGSDVGQTFRRVLQAWRARE
jgi:cytidylate kinase